MFGHATALASITTMSAMSAALATGTILMAVPGVSNSSAHDAMHCNLRRWRAAGDARDAVESQLRTVRQAGGSIDENAKLAELAAVRH